MLHWHNRSRPFRKNKSKQRICAILRDTANITHRFIYGATISWINLNQRSTLDLLFIVSLVLIAACFTLQPFLIDNRMAYGFPPTPYPNLNQTNGFHSAIKTPSLATNYPTTTSHGFPPTPLFTKYVNDTDGISVAVPQDWGVEAGQNQPNATSLVVIHMTPPLSQDPNALVDVYIYKDTQPHTNSSIVQYLRDEIDYLRGNNGFKLGLTTTGINIAGQQGYQYQASFIDSAQPIKIQETGMLLGGNAYYVYYYAPSNLFSTLLPQVNQIVQSLRVNPPTSASSNNNFATPSTITAPQRPSNMTVANSTAASSPNNLSALVDKGNALYQQGNFTQATQYYDKALAIDPKDEHALDGKGEALLALGNDTEAIQYYDKALAIDPKDKDALIDKGLVLNDLGNHTQAIQYYDKALAIDPKDELALHEKGDALLVLGNYTQAIQSYDKALAIWPKDELVLLDKANDLTILGNYTQAIQYYDKALAIDPKADVALVDKGNALTHLGNYTQAIQYYDKALAIDPKDKDALNGIQIAISKLNLEPPGNMTATTSSSNMTKTSSNSTSSNSSNLTGLDSKAKFATKLGQALSNIFGR